MAQRTTVRPADVGAGSVQSRDLLLGVHRAVADVVDPAREGVYGGQRPPLVAWQQRDAVGEVLGLLAGDPLALTGGRAGGTRLRTLLVPEAQPPPAQAR